jgi:hypothetical protein
MADAAGRTQWQSTNLDEVGGRYMILLLLLLPPPPPPSLNHLALV